MQFIANQGIPTNKMNANYWLKKIEKFFEKTQTNRELSYSKFAEMDYRDVFKEALGEFGHYRYRLVQKCSVPA